MSPQHDVPDVARLTRTRKCIIAALLQLMEKEPFADISITQITQQAEVARRTFYLNYASKEDILRNCIGAMAADFTEEITNRKDETLEQMVHSFYSYWSRHANLLKLLYQNDLFSLLLNTYEELIPKVGPIQRIIESQAGDDEWCRQHGPTLIGTVVWRVQLEWMRSDMAESIEELTAITMDMAPRFLFRPQP